MRIGVLCLLPLLALVAACSSQNDEPAAPVLTFHDVMKDKVDKNAVELWDISIAAIGWVMAAATL